ncbi:hypothetical protein [Radiobacillus sp. PE A8.2]|uniref:hypothetical protein n=1 Tax=Radiobacillus sp. PE A8.2 TaxID=3380349 RepID=UPI00388F2397
MTIRELYNDAVIYDEPHLILLLDFLLFEKRTINLDDEKCVLDLYFKKNNRNRLNKLVLEYKREKV